MSGTVHFPSPGMLFQFAVDSVLSVKVVCVLAIGELARFFARAVEQ